METCSRPGKCYHPHSTDGKVKAERAQACLPASSLVSHPGRLYTDHPNQSPGTALPPPNAPGPTQPFHALPPGWKGTCPGAAPPGVGGQRAATQSWPIGLLWLMRGPPPSLRSDKAVTGSVLRGHGTRMGVPLWLEGAAVRAGPRVTRSSWGTG